MLVSSVACTVCARAGAAQSASETANPTQNADPRALPRCRLMATPFLLFRYECGQRCSDTAHSQWPVATTHCEICDDFVSRLAARRQWRPHKSVATVKDAAIR